LSEHSLQQYNCLRTLQKLRPHWGHCLSLLSINLIVSMAALAGFESPFICSTYFPSTSNKSVALFSAAAVFAVSKLTCMDSNVPLIQTPPQTFPLRKRTTSIIGQPDQLHSLSHLFVRRPETAEKIERIRVLALPHPNTIASSKHLLKFPLGKRMAARIIRVHHDI
jgi:hypothetical protein